MLKRKRTHQPPEIFLDLADKARLNYTYEVKLFEERTGFKVEENFLHKLALLTQVSIKKSELDYNHGRIVYSTLRKYLENFETTEPVNILEIGTAKGFSSVLMSQAIEDSKRNGIILTVDVVGHINPYDWNSIMNADGKLVSRKEILKNYTKQTQRIIFIKGKSPSILKNIYLSRINFAFIDGMHEYKNVKSEFEYIKNHQFKEDVIIFDDYSPNLFPGVVKVVEEIRISGEYSIEILVSSKSRGYAIATKNIN